VTDLASQCLSVEVTGQSKTVCEYYKGAPEAFHKLYADITGGAKVLEPGVICHVDAAVLQRLLRRHRPLASGRPGGRTDPNSAQPTELPAAGHRRGPGRMGGGEPRGRQHVEPVRSRHTHAP